MELITLKIITALIFIVSYTVIIMFYDKKHYIIWSGIGIIFLFGIISIHDALISINWNVMGIFLGTMIIAELFTYSKMPAYLATLFVNKSRTVVMAILSLCLLSGIISAFVENVAVVLILAPIAFAVAKKLRKSPVPFIVGIAVSSNLQGAATLVGDPPSMILAGFSKMTFNDFIFMDGKPSIFFAVQIGAVISLIVLYFLFRKYNQQTPTVKLEKVKSYFPTWLMAAMILLLALSSFIDKEFSYMAGIICTILGIVGIFWYKFYADKSIGKQIKDIDWATAVFLAGIFVMVGALSSIGIISDITSILSDLTGQNSFLAFNVLVWVSVLLSGFIDNVPYLTAMIPVASALANNVGANPYLFMFGLLVGASIGGNITPIGASANVVGCGILQKKGFPISFWQFIKIGLPFTIFSVLGAIMFLWVVWS